MSAVSSERDRHMILSPLEWPLLVLPLKRHSKGGLPDAAVFCPPLNRQGISPDDPITIRLCNMFMLNANAPEQTYENVDALLADGWRVD